MSGDFSFKLATGGQPLAMATNGHFMVLTVGVSESGDLDVRIIDECFMPVTELDERVSIPRAIIDELYRRHGG